MSVMIYDTANSAFKDIQAMQRYDPSANAWTDCTSAKVQENDVWVEKWKSDICILDSNNGLLSDWSSACNIGSHSVYNEVITHSVSSNGVEVSNSSDRSRDRYIGGVAYLSTIPNKRYINISMQAIASGSDSCYAQCIIRLTTGNIYGFNSDTILAQNTYNTSYVNADGNSAILYPDYDVFTNTGNNTNETQTRSYYNFLKSSMGSNYPSEWDAMSSMGTGSFTTQNFKLDLDAFLTANISYYDYLMSIYPQDANLYNAYKNSIPYLKQNKNLFRIYVTAGAINYPAHNGHKDNYGYIKINKIWFSDR